MPFKLAIVGVGQIAQQAHLPAALGVPGVEVVALVDPASDRVRAVCDDFGIAPRIATNVADVLGDVDGAIVAAPNRLHCEIACACLEAGVPVLVEKPLAASVADAEAIRRSETSGGAICAVGYCTRFRDSVLLLMRLLASEYFGSVRGFAYQFGTEGGWATFSDYTLDRAATGGGVLMVTGTHFIDRMLALFGYPDDMAYEEDARGGPEANAIARFRYLRNGRAIEGAARFSKTTRLNAGLVIDTDRGTVILGESDDSPLCLRPHDGGEVAMVLRDRRPSPFPPGADVFQRQLLDFIEACRSGTKPMVSAEEAVLSLRLIESLYERATPMTEDWYLPSSAGDRRS